MSQHIRLSLVFQRSGQQVLVHLPQSVISALRENSGGMYTLEETGSRDEHTANSHSSSSMHGA